MITKEIRKVRCDDALAVLMEYNEAVFFTLTTPDRVDYEEIRGRWRRLRHAMLRTLRRLYPAWRIHYVMNYEMHPGYLQKRVTDSHGERILRGDGISHGWHIHGVFNCFVPLNAFRSMLDCCGFGRVDVRRVKTRGVSDYLTKHALKAYQGMTAKERKQYGGCRRRLVNTSRGLPPLSDYRYTSPLLEDVRLLMSQTILEDRDRRRHMSLDPSLDPFDPRQQRLLRDYRIIRQRAEVCSLLGLTSLHQLCKFVERLYMPGNATNAHKYDMTNNTPKNIIEKAAHGSSGPNELNTRASGGFDECKKEKNPIIPPRQHSEILV